MANGSWKIARNRGGAQLPIALLAAFAIALILIGKAQSNLFDRARAGGHRFRGAERCRRCERRCPGSTAGWRRSARSSRSTRKTCGSRMRTRGCASGRTRPSCWTGGSSLIGVAGLHAVPDPSLSSVLARVIGRSNRPFLQTMILDAGRAQGIKPGQAVIDARGMIGRIFLTGEHTSWVILLTDLNSRIPVSIMPGNVQAIMAGDNAGGADHRPAVPERPAEGGRPGRQFGRWRPAAARPRHRHGGRQSVRRFPRRAAGRRGVERGRQHRRFQAEGRAAAGRLAGRPAGHRRRPAARRAAPPPVVATPLRRRHPPPRHRSAGQPLAAVLATPGAPMPASRSPRRPSRPCRTTTAMSEGGRGARGWQRR